MKPWLSLLALTLSLACPPLMAAPDAGTGKGDQKQKAKPAKRADHSGRKQRGKASYYSRKFAGKKMADGTPMDPNAPVAASKTLPLGTKAEVKNLETGKKAEVEITDRGPYVKDRIIDVSPSTAKKLDMHKDGVAPVEVTPLEIPPPDTAGKAGKDK